MALQGVGNSEFKDRGWLKSWRVALSLRYVTSVVKGKQKVGIVSCLEHVCPGSSPVCPPNLPQDNTLERRAIGVFYTEKIMGLEVRSRRF